MIFIDFEVFKHDWLCVAIDSETEKYHKIANDPEELKKLYESNIDNIWVGYNIRGYDQYVMKAILLDLNPKELNDFIILQHRKGWEFSNEFNNVQLNIYDCMTSQHGLKQLEGFMGNNIKETSVSFNLDRKLTHKEIEETFKYCTHDVEQTVEAFTSRISEFEAHLGLIQEFNLPLKYISKTKVQLSAIILGARKQSRDDEFNLTILPNIELSKYSHVADFYKNPINYDYKKELNTVVAGVPHTFGWGGIHGAREKYHGSGIFINVDVASFYPALMIEYGFLSRNVDDPLKFKEIRDKRLEYKKAKDPKEKVLKIVINGTYGASKDKFSQLYDPLQANNVCVNGQLMLLDLIEKLEPHCQIIQSNTDGILIKIPSLDTFSIIDDICYEWEQRTKMELEFDTYIKVAQKDVNNYIIIPPGELYDEKGKPRWKAKGAYVKFLNDLDNDLPIVNKAVEDYLIKNKLPEETINSSNKLIDFQKIVKISSNYEYGMLGHWTGKGKAKKFIGTELVDKCFRVFASKSSKDGIYKVKENPEKFANTPECVFIDNDDIKNKPIPSDLDKQWYVDLAWKRLGDFGV